MHFWFYFEPEIRKWLWDNYILLWKWTIWYLKQVTSSDGDLPFLLEGK